MALNVFDTLIHFAKAVLSGSLRGQDRIDLRISLGRDLPVLDDWGSGDWGIEADSGWRYTSAAQLSGIADGTHLVLCLVALRASGLCGPLLHLRHDTWYR